MRRHHLKLLSLWILPLLVLRALIPTGFMLSVDAGRLQMMFCPSGVVQPLGASQASQHQAHGEHHAGMHHGGGAEQSPSHTADDNAPCPFSLVASAAPSDVPYLSGAVDAPRDEHFEFLSAPTFRVGPVRTDRIRGPPSHA